MIHLAMIRWTMLNWATRQLTGERQSAAGQVLVQSSPVVGAGKGDEVELGVAVWRFGELKALL